MVVVGVGELGIEFGRAVIHSEAQVFVELVRVHDLPGIHPVVRVEQRFGLFERPDHALAEHDRQQLAARLAVAMLAGQGAAVFDNEPRRILHEGTVFGDAFAVRNTKGMRVCTQPWPKCPYSDAVP